MPPTDLLEVFVPIERLVRSPDTGYRTRVLALVGGFVHSGSWLSPSRFDANNADLPIPLSEPFPVRCPAADVFICTASWGGEFWAGDLGRREV